jgi:hypothetical protein
MILIGVRERGKGIGLREGKRGGGGEEGDFWELNKLPEILDKMDKDKVEMREAAEERRKAENRKRLLQRAA